MSNPTMIAIATPPHLESAHRTGHTGHAIYQVTLDGLGRRRRHNAGRSALGRHSESSQPPPPESAPLTGRHHPARMTLSSGMTPERSGKMRDVQRRSVGDSAEQAMTLRTARLILTPLSPVDEADHARASGNSD